jgi:hypothetical protein
MSKPKPIRVFFSDLSQRFYATQHYREDTPGVVIVTGDKFDVTDDIARVIKYYKVTFLAKKAKKP